MPYLELLEHTASGVHAHAHTHSHTRTRTHTPTHKYVRTNAHARMLTHTHTQTQTHTRSSPQYLPKVFQVPCLQFPGDKNPDRSLFIQPREPHHASLWTHFMIHTCTHLDSVSVWGYACVYLCVWMHHGNICAGCVSVQECRIGLAA